MSHQVVTSPATRAQGLVEQLRALLQALEAFERELKARPSPTIREGFRPHHVAIAMRHLTAAMDALEIVSAEEVSNRGRDIALRSRPLNRTERARRPPSE